MEKIKQFPEPYRIYKPPPKKEQCHPELPTPVSLLEIAGYHVDGLPFPPAWYWTVPRVIWWLRYEMKLPEFEETFRKNFINGRRLLLLNANRLAQMNIHDFTIINRIMEARRSLFKIERIEFNRSISLPPRKPLTHFLLYRAITGRMREAINRTSLFRMMHIIQLIPCVPTHWDRIDTEKPEFPRNTIGYVRKPFPKPVVPILLTRP